VEPLLSSKQAAELLGMSPKTVRSWARRGLIVGVRLGGRDWKFRASDLEAAFERALTSQRAPAALAPRLSRTPAVGRVPSTRPDGRLLSVSDRLKLRREREANGG
jgi:excisionase family DNA binding protein